jgi:hypothetical protein
MRSLLTALPICLLLAACGSSVDSFATPKGPVAAQPLVTITGKGRSMLIPPTYPSPGFAKINLDLVRTADVANPNSDVAPAGRDSLGHMALQTAAPSCEIDGCQWHMRQVAISDAPMGLMAVLSDARTTQPVWHTTYAQVVNPNQIKDSLTQATAINASAPGYMLAHAAVEKLATLLMVTPDEMVARGVCIGLVWAGRGEGTGYAKGVEAARVAIADANAKSVPTVVYLNDALTTVVTTGTNTDGLFVLLGPLHPATPVLSYSVPLTITNASAAGVFDNTVAIVRPGAVTVMPMIPRR